MRALGAAADGARDVQRRARLRPAGQDEAAQRRQRRLERVDPALEPRDVVRRDRGLRHAIRDLVPRIRQPRAKGEQIPLDLLEHDGQLPSSAATSVARANPSQALSSSTSP